MNRPHSLTDSATAKLNQAERFGVGLGETCGLNSDEDLPPERLDLELEQHYHTRLLAHVLDVFDLTFQVVPPPFVMRQFVKTGVFLPERLGILFVGAAEMAGCAMFDELRRVGIELFADEPKAAERSRCSTAKSSPSSDTSVLRVALHGCRTGRHAVALPAHRKGCLPAKPLKSGCWLTVTSCARDSTVLSTLTNSPPA